MSFDPLLAIGRTASSALQSQAMRLKIVSENLANMESAGRAAGADPYLRKIVTFEETLDEATGASLVSVGGILRDRSPLRKEYDPSHPAADNTGYVKLPNVNMMVELADMREAGRSYEANLQMIRQGRELTSMMVDLLKNS